MEGVWGGVEMWKNKQKPAVAHNDFLTVYMNKQYPLGLLLSIE